MNKVDRAKKASELFDLVNYYYENRDRPVSKDFDFYEKIKDCCLVLDIDLVEFKKEFKIDASYS